MHPQALRLSTPTPEPEVDSRPLMRCERGCDDVLHACRVAGYRRVSRLFDELAQARADGTLPLLLRRLAKTNVLILDDFGLEVLGVAERKGPLEVLEDRYDTSSTIASQLAPDAWPPAGWSPAPW